MSAPDGIVFLAANASFSHSSLALRYLAGGVDPARWRTVLVECTVRDDPEVVIERMAGHRPRVLATTLYLFNRTYLRDLLRRWKARHPHVVVIGGGPECLGDNRKLLEELPELDLVVRGEGEIALASILERIDTPAAWTDIPGVCLARNGELADGGAAEGVADLDDLPWPYARFPPVPDKPFVHLETSRGCSNACAFCTSAGTAPVRRVSLDRTRRELAALRAAGVRQVRLIDRTFNEQPRRAVALLAMFRDAFPELGFHLEIDPALLTEPVMAALRQAPAGQLHLEAGIQSLQAAVLRGVHRRGSLEHAVRQFRALCGLPNLRVHADLMAGLPGMTLDMLLADLERLTQWAPAEIQLEILKILPGTPLAGDAACRGLVWKDSPPYTVRATPDMPPKALRTAQRLSILVDRLYNAASLQPVLVQAIRRMDRGWEKLVDAFPTRESLDVLRPLEPRFVFLDRFFREQGRDECRHALQYAWMRKGLSARNGICRAQPLRHGVPANVRLIEGDAALPVARAYRLEAGGSYVFAYAAGRAHGRIGAIYEVV